MKEIQKMTEAGYLAGTIVMSKEEGDCPVMIRVDGDDSTYYLDPINLDKAMEVENSKVWFKFRPLRMANRCTRANPISLEDIKKREE